MKHHIDLAQPVLLDVISDALFATDLTLRQYGGRSLFAFAAPAGGTLLILSWLALAVAAAWPRPTS